MKQVLNSIKVNNLELLLLERRERTARFVKEVESSFKLFDIYRHGAGLTIEVFVGSCCATIDIVGYSVTISSASPFSKDVVSLVHKQLMECVSKSVLTHFEVIASN